MDHVKIQGIAQAGDWRKIWKKLKTANQGKGRITTN